MTDSNMSVSGDDFLALQQAVVDQLLPVYKEINSLEKFEKLATALKSLKRQQDVINVAFQLNRVFPNNVNKFILAKELSHGTDKQKLVALKILYDIQFAEKRGSKFNFNVFMVIFRLTESNKLRELFKMYGDDYIDSYDFQALKLNIPNINAYYIFKETPRCCNVHPICSSKSVKEHVSYYIKFSVVMSTYRYFLFGITVLESIFRQNALVHWIGPINLPQGSFKSVPELYDYLISNHLSDNPLVGPEKYRICVGCSNTITEFLQCSKCKLVAYCNRECQLKNWEEHKGLCTSPKRTKFVRIDDPKKCTFCLLEKAPLKCPCNKARYCDKICQEQDWSNHRSKCNRKKCSACKKRCPKSMCSCCKKAYYCNKDCQCNDWQHHSTVCPGLL